MNGTEPGTEALDVAAALDEVAAAMLRHLGDRQGMSFTASSTLSRLERAGAVRLTGLATAEGVAQPSMTQLVQRLERQGLVLRRPEPNDGRVTLVEITDAGRALLEERRQARRARLATLLAGLPETEERALAEAMRTALPIVRRLVRDAVRAGGPAAG